MRAAHIGGKAIRGSDFEAMVANVRKGMVLEAVRTVLNGEYRYYKEKMDAYYQSNLMDRGRLIETGVFKTTRYARVVWPDDLETGFNLEGKPVNYRRDILRHVEQLLRAPSQLLSEGTYTSYQ